MQRPSVLVTGGAKRIGAAISARFARGGWHVAVHTHRPSADALAVADRLPSAEAIAFDLADPAAIARAVAGLAAALPDWRALVCNAALFLPDSAPAPDLSVWQQVMDVNVRGNHLLAAGFLAQARAASARTVVNLLDQKLENLNPDFCSYTVSKAALRVTGDMLAMACPQDRILGLAPGLSLPSHDQTEAEFAQTSRMNLLGRRTTPEEIAEAAWFLVTGPVASNTIIHVDSGQHLVEQRRDVMYAIRETQP